MRRSLSAALLLAVLLPIPGARAQEPRAVDVVARLYRTYEWETRDGAAGPTPLFAASPAEMRAFLDSGLVAAVMADRECEERMEGICNLDFDPVWASQDPSGAVAHVVGTSDGGVVRVEIRYPNPPRAVLVTYHLRPTPAGWRIIDLGTAEWPSLEALLRQPVP